MLQTRQAVTAHFSSTQAQIQRLIDDWISLEQNVRKTVKRYAAPDERLLPNALYVTLSGFAGSIFAKNKSLFVRASLPATTACVSFAYLFPGTTRNIFKNTWADASSAGLLPERIPGADFIDSATEGINSVRQGLSKSINYVKEIWK